MASLYASLTGTAVLLQRRVPARPQDAPHVEDRDDIGALAEAWNGRQYEERGWTSFEYGVASMAAAHMRRIAVQLQRQRRTAPDAVRKAEGSRPKVIDLDEAAAPAATEVVGEAAPEAEPVALLRALTKRVEGAAFTNNADRTAVAHMLFALEWTMHVAMDEVIGRGEGRARLTADAHRSGLRFRRATIHTVPGESSGEGDGGTGGAGRHGGNVHTDGVQLLKRSGKDVQVEMA